MGKVDPTQLEHRWERIIWSRHHGPNVPKGGWSQGELGARIPGGLAQQTIQHIENPPRYDKAKPKYLGDIAFATGVSYRWLVDGIGSPWDDLNQLPSGLADEVEQFIRWLRISWRTGDEEQRVWLKQQIRVHFPAAHQSVEETPNEGEDRNLRALTTVCRTLPPSVQQHLLNEAELFAGILRERTAR